VEISVELGRALLITQSVVNGNKLSNLQIVVSSLYLLLNNKAEKEFDDIFNRFDYTAWSVTNRRTDKRALHTWFRIPAIASVSNLECSFGDKYLTMRYKVIIKRFFLYIVYIVGLH